EETAQRFLDNPFKTGKMYRTGDMARWSVDRYVEFLGRGDDQVKIRGFRVELGEVEATLRRHPSVKQAVVIVKADERGDKRLLAYVVEQSGADLETLKNYLKEQLPEHMLPS